ncbi:MAG: hypothetical protein JRJ45_00255 [Deltaproteobacteria bacterium]|nr:hypothetical protein [Deltaproteobacteria bacterium]
MTVTRVVTQEFAEKKAAEKKNKKDNKGKVWQNLSTNEQMGIIEADLRARGVIE